jgi:DegV family protein with EDD domain
MSRPTADTGLPARSQPTGRVAIVAESTCCLPDALAEQYHITILPIPYVFGAETYRDGVDLTRAQFYEKLAATRTPPMTSPPSPGEYLQAWRDAARDADAVVCVTVASGISTLQRSARLAQELAGDALPGKTVEVVDSLSAGMGQGFVALAAARAAAEGQSLDEIVRRAKQVAERVQLLVTLDTLDYLAKVSRIPQVAALLGGVLQIKPIIRVAHGSVHPLTRVRTRHRSIEQLLEYLRQDVRPDQPLHAAVQHAAAPEEAAALEARIRAEFTCAELYTTEFTPVMGGYCGPGLLGVAYYQEQMGDAS